MKNTLITSLILLLLITSCKKNDDQVSNNNYIPNAVFDTEGLINTNLPQFNNMQFPGNYITLNSPYGINGVVVYYSGGSTYSAFELTDPNHPINGCSALAVNNAKASCTCDDGNSFEIVTGLPLEGNVNQFTLIPYHVEVNGNIIRVYNN